jgi:hypothetical protein
MANNFRKFKNPEPVIPGRPVDFQMGGQAPVHKRAYQLLREVENVKSEIGDVDVTTTPATSNDVLVFDGTTWLPVDKASLLAINDLTDVAVSGAVANQVIKHNGTQWVNAAITELLALNDLSDVTIAAVADGDLLVYNGGSSLWGNRNWTPAAFGVGAAATNGKFEITPGTVSTFFTDSSVLSSGIKGWRIDKTLAATAFPHGWTWTVAGVRLVDVGMDFNTAANGRSDFVLIGDHTFGASDDTFGDVFRYSLAADCMTHGNETGKFEIGSPAGSPKAKSDFITINGGDDTTGLGGVRINYWSSNTTYHALGLLNRHGTSRRAGINFDDLWVLQTDHDADGGQELTMSTGGVLHWQIASPGQVAQFYVDAATNTAPYAYRLQHNTSGTAAAGFGVGMQFYGETTTGADAEIVALSAVLTDATNGSHAGYLSIFAAGAGAGVERARFHGDGRAGVASGGANPLATGVEWNITKTAGATPSIKTYLQILGAADTALTASTEASDVIFNLGRTVQFATGALADQRAVKILAPTYAFVAASTLTNPSTVYIDNAPTAGANATFTNGPYSLFVDGGLARFDGNGSHVFELPADATDPTGGGGAATGRIPVLIGGVLRYVPYY